jgi:hypothetical protein
MTAPTAVRTVQNMLTEIKRSFGDESNVQLKDADIIRWINSGQIEIINKNPILKAISTTPGLKDQSSYNIPSDCIQMEMVQVNEIILRACSWEEVRDLTAAGAQSGQPQVWALYANKIFLYPSPDQNENITIYYAKRPTDVTSAGDLLSIPDRYYDRLKEYIMSRAYEMDEDWTAHQVQRDQFESNLLALSNAEHNVQGPYLVAMDPDYEGES